MNEKTISLDAKGQSLGRLASRVAFLLRGKHEPGYNPSAAPAQKIIVKNCRQLKIATKKLEQKRHYRTSGFPGAIKETLMRDAFAKDPSALFLRTVKGMLPANRQRRVALANLKIEN